MFTLRSITIALAALVSAGGAWWLNAERTSPAESERLMQPASTKTPVSSTESKVKPDGSVEEQTERDRIVGLLQGEWEQDYYGHRHFTVKADGTAVLRMQPEGFFYRNMLGKELTIDMEWSLSGRELTLVTVGGHPANKVKLATKIVGERKVKIIEEIAADHLLLRDPSDGELEPALARVEK